MTKKVHFWTPNNGIACGLSSNDHVVTTKISDVDCKNCRITSIYQTVRFGVATQQELFQITKADLWDCLVEETKIRGWFAVSFDIATSDNDIAKTVTGWVEAKRTQK